MRDWDYQTAFSRNLGLLTTDEQERLRTASVAIAGMGGVGGVHLMTLARMGVGGFHIADLDRFQSANFNRQYGATIHTLNRPKVDVMAEMAKAVNPDLELSIYSQGLTPQNVSSFVEGADVVIDGIDFFAIGVKRLLFQAARSRGVPALTSGPLGFGATLHVFSPTGMSFDEYFDLSEAMTALDQLIAFAVGLAPSGLHLRYLDLTRVDLQAETGPSSMIACQLASALVATEVVNIVLGRRRVRVAPEYSHFDPYLNRYVARRLPRGNRHWKQRIKRWMLKRKLEGTNNGSSFALPAREGERERLLADRPATRRS